MHPEEKKSAWVYEKPKLRLCGQLRPSLQFTPPAPPGPIAPTITMLNATSGLGGRILKFP